MSNIIFGVTAQTNNNNNDIEGKYSNVYFWIDTDAYHHNNGWNDDKKHIYETELYEILTEQGWSIERPKINSASMTTQKGKSFLYLHPQNYSGVCENREREKLFEVFKKAKTFTCRSVDIYEEIFDMTDEQLNEKLNNEKANIEIEILESFTTKRSNLYITDFGYFGVNGNIGKRHSVKRLEIDGKKNFHGIDDRTEGICVSFVSDIFNKLVDDGKIVSANTKNGIGYRTAKKTELKKKVV